MEQTDVNILLHTQCMTNNEINRDTRKQLQGKRFVKHPNERHSIIL